MLGTKHLILLWIIILIGFIYYCIYRQINTTSYTNSHLKFDNIPPNQPIPPMNATSNTAANIFSYLNDVSQHDKITDVPGCDSVFDDNIGVRSLGYNSCSTAFTDYFNKNLDPNNNYGQSKTLSDLCPISTKSPKYMDCLEKLLNKFTANQQMSSDINQDITNIINQRIQKRNNILAGIEVDMSPYLNNADLQEFRNNNITSLPENITPDEKLRLINNYYKSKFGSGGISAFINIHPENEHFTVNPTRTTTQSQSDIQSDSIDPYIKTNFFGYYVPIKGQFMAFNNLTVSIGFDTTPQNQSSQQSSQQQPPRIVLNIVDNDSKAMITYKISSIDYYNAMINVLKIEIESQIIKTNQPNDSQALQQLLMIMGLTPPSRVFLSMEKITSTEGKDHFMYKLLNIGMDTIMVMNKSTV